MPFVQSRGILKVEECALVATPASTKDTGKALLERLPDDCSLEGVWSAGAFPCIQ